MIKKVGSSEISSQNISEALKSRLSDSIFDVIKHAQLCTKGSKFSDLIQVIKEGSNLDEKTQHFLVRTLDHIRLVIDGVDKIIEVFPEFREAKRNVLNHDALKFADPEISPYVEIAWRYKTKDVSKATEDQNNATLHHILHSEHHPEYWAADRNDVKINTDNRDEAGSVIDVSNMPPLAMVEMVADWYALVVEKNQNTIREWFEKVRDTRYNFSPDQLQLIEKFVGVFEPSKTSNYVFLGGTCNNSTWREELISKLKVSYFNPIVEDWTEECQKEEIRQRESCKYLLYVITPKMAGQYAIAESVDDSNKRPTKTVFCIIEVDDQVTFDQGQLKSLNQVGEMIKRNGGKFLRSLDDVASVLNEGEVR